MDSLESNFAPFPAEHGQPCNEVKVLYEKKLLSGVQKAVFEKFWLAKSLSVAQGVQSWKLPIHFQNSEATNWHEATGLITFSWWSAR